MGEDLRHGGLPPHEPLGLEVEFGYGGGARAGYGLVRRGDDALDGPEATERVQRHHQRNGGAVRLRDDPLVALDLGGVDFGHDQRDGGIEPERRAIVDDDGAGFDGGGAPHLRGCGAGGEEGDIDAVERGGGRLHHFDHLTAHAEFGPRRARRGEQAQIADPRAPTAQYLEELGADRAGRADKSDT